MIGMCDNYYTMGTSPISDPLRRAIVASGMSYKALSRGTGVTRASIQRFVDGRHSLRLDIADRLAALLGLALQAEKGGSREHG
ncbi:MAG: helix-turn-helix transcriptional regulator [Isosphaeraceae bacterium]|nr:helix-turn-helix transcriptional regulator [Isosphaeraceae bacterium]